MIVLKFLFFYSSLGVKDFNHFYYKDGEFQMKNLNVTTQSNSSNNLKIRRLEKTEISRREISKHLKRVQNAIKSKPETSLKMLCGSTTSGCGSWSERRPQLVT